MTEPVLDRWTLTSGGWCCVLGSDVLVMLPADQRDRAVALWSAVDEGAPLPRLLDLLLADGLAALDDLVVVATGGSVTTAVVRGATARVELATPDGPVEVTGTGARTWVERTVTDVTGGRVTTGDDDGDTFTLPAGLVRAAGATWGDAAAPVVDDGPADAAAPALPVAAPAAPALPGEPEPPEPSPLDVDDETSDQPTPGYEPEPTPESTPEPEMADEPLDAPEPADEEPELLAPAPPAAPAMAPPMGAPTPGLPPPPAPPAPVDPAAAAPAPDHDHDGRAEAPAHRWRVAFDTGQDLVVEGMTLVGRDPEPRPGEPVRHVVPLGSDDMSLSKTHAQFQVVPDGALVVMDRGSTNGTVVLRQGVARSLTAGRPATLVDGDVVRFGDRTMTVRREPV
ncbi:MAG: hypothetical protein CMH83_12510 [Nocardioides sp.]|nr:hypothetical protein [Nocardioides sp.]